MSWNYTVHLINAQFERLANWYREFMHRTEQSFQTLHERILNLENRQPWTRPSDEQVERVLRKILAEKFADAEIQRVDGPNAMQAGHYFVEDPKQELVLPKVIPFELATIDADPETAVPSKAYGETLKMLENSLPNFPRVDLRKPSDTDSNDVKSPQSPQPPPNGSMAPPTSPQQVRRWPPPSQ